MIGKIFQALLRKIPILKKWSSKTVFTNGKFDVLHVQHFNLLSYCRELAGPRGKVIVAIDVDEKIINDTKNSPVFGQWERTSALAALKTGDGQPLINTVVHFGSNAELKTLMMLTKADIIVKGEDWKGNVVGSNLVEVKYFPYSDKWSSTKIKQKIREEK